MWQSPRLGAEPGRDQFNLAKLEALYSPAAQAKIKSMSANDDPVKRCEPSAFPRAAALGWPIQISQRPGWVFVYNEAFNNSYRMIPTKTEGQHAAPCINATSGGGCLAPSNFGNSAGRWEGDTLVVDVLSFNGLTWLAGGEDKPAQASAGVWPSSDAMHVVERWRRVDENTLEYQARVEDPKMLTAPWETPKVALKKQPPSKVDEVKCQRR